MNEKSVLVMDTPNNCSECPCCYVSENDWGDFISARCQMKYKGFVNEYSEYNKGRPSWCPLRPLPEKQKLTVTGKNQIEKKRIIKSKSLEQIKKGFINNSEVAFYCGYNACLDEILGETE